jgi:hypothetical protein
MKALAKLGQKATNKVTDDLDLNKKKKSKDHG